MTLTHRSVKVGPAFDPSSTSARAGRAAQIDAPGTSLARGALLLFSPIATNAVFRKIGTSGAIQGSWISETLRYNRSVGLGDKLNPGTSDRQGGSSHFHSYRAGCRVGKTKSDESAMHWRPLPNPVESGSGSEGSSATPSGFPCAHAPFSSPPQAAAWVLFSPLFGLKRRLFRKCGAY